jgi:Domain of unknown function (DUF5017)
MKQYKKITLAFIAIFSIIGCSPEDDITIAEFTDYIFYEDFLSNTTDGEDISIEGWTNFVEAGTVKWMQGIYSGTKYAEFTSYQSGEASNIAWLVSTPINMDTKENETLTFDIAQAYVSSSSNSIELFISSNYNGTDVLAATWTPLTFNRPPLDFDTNFDFFSSGLIDLSSYTGNVYLAFKCKGSGTNTSLDGTYEIDNIRIFDQK